MMRRILRKTNSFLLAAAMAVALMPAPMMPAAELDGTAVLQQEEKQALELEPITVIEGNAPVFPRKVSTESSGAAAEVQWDQWDTGTAAGEYTATGTTVAGEQITVAVNVLPCDEVVADAAATGTGNDDRNAIHPLKGYKGLFVTEYDIVPDSTKSTHDRAVIYLPDRIMKNGNWEELNSGNCWDTGARLQFKHGYNDVTYFQTQIGDGQVADNAVYYPTNDELDEALANGDTSKAWVFDEVSTYRVRTVMDTASDTTKGNVKIYITDPDGIEHEVTQPGGNGFRIYPENGIISQFAAVRGSYTLKNHKVSWISGYATKQVETYLKAQDAAEYTKYETVSAKELPGAMPAEQPEAEIIKNNQMYVLDTEMSGWYKGEDKSEAVAEAGETVTYRAYYKAVDKADLNDKIQNASGLAEEDYTAGSWQTYQEALTKANQINTDTTASQEAVDNAVGTLDTAERNLVSIKNLKAAIAKLKAELEEKEGQKADYANWDEVQKALKDAEEILGAANATKSQVETAEENLAIKLILNTQLETEEAKKAMETSVTAAEQKMAGLKEVDYTPASWSAIKAALEACKALNPETASKADYEAAKTALDRAVSGLAKLADKTALHQAIADAKAKKEADYEAAGYRSMQEKLAVANTVAANPNATQSEVDAAKTALQDAVSKLTARQSEVKVTSVRRAAKTYKIAAGKKLDLKKVFTALPEHADNRKLTYSIDKKYKKYASIKSGVVTVKKAGAGKTIAVKATAADGSGKTATVKIKIMKNAVTKITVKKKTLTVKAGKKVTIKPVVRTNGKDVNKTLEYTSSNEKLATVKKGVVTAKKGKKGTVTITIKSTDGTNKSVKVKVTIRK